MEELSKCKMALNLSRGKPIKYTSSNRIASLIGNGIYTFIDKKTKFTDFFNENEVGSYSNIDELGNKIENLLSNEKKRYMSIQKMEKINTLNYLTIKNFLNIVEKIF